MNKSSSYPTAVDPLVFFQDVNLENRNAMDTFQENMKRSWSIAQEAVENESVFRYCADLMHLFQNRIRALQEFLQGGGAKPDFFRYSSTAPSSIEEGQAWIDINYD